MTYSDAVHELYVDMSIYGVIIVVRWFFDGYRIDPRV